jgi:hypothetical protein
MLILLEFPDLEVPIPKPPFGKPRTFFAFLSLSLISAFRMGELEPWVDESHVRTIWYNMGEQVNVKMIRDKFTGYEAPSIGDD